MWVIWQASNGLWCVGVADRNGNYGEAVFERYPSKLDAVRLVNVLNGGRGEFNVELSETYALALGPYAANPKPPYDN